MALQVNYCTRLLCARLTPDLPLCDKERGGVSLEPPLSVTPLPVIVVAPTVEAWLGARIPPPSRSPADACSLRPTGVLTGAIFFALPRPHSAHSPVPTACPSALARLPVCAGTLARTMFSTTASTVARRVSASTYVRDRTGEIYSAARTTKSMSPSASATMSCSNKRPPVRQATASYQSRAADPWVSADRGSRECGEGCPRNAEKWPP